MNKDSLIKARDIITDSLNEHSKNLTIEQKIDVLELMININQFLQPDKYEENIRTLRKG